MNEDERLNQIKASQELIERGDVFTRGETRESRWVPLRVVSTKKTKSGVVVGGIEWGR